MSRMKWDDIAAIERKSIKMGLAVNEDKMKYMWSISKNILRIGSPITVNNFAFDVAKEFV